MIIGLMLKNFKTYNGLKYIPISNEYKFSAFIGDNGIGKSSILEALDCYFNDSNWNINKQATSERGSTGANIPHIVPIFLIKKELLKQTTRDDKENFDLACKLSNLLWETEPTKLHVAQNEAKEFLSYRDNLIKFKDTHLLIISGKRHNRGNEIFFSSFEKLIQNNFCSNDEIENATDLTEDESKKEQEDKIFRSQFSKFNEYIKSHFSYTYIPVEINIEDFTKLETTDMQKLLGKDIRNVINEAVKKLKLDNLNTQLNTFINEIQKNLEKYKYKNKSGRTKISENELIDKIIELFFSIRTLHKDEPNSGKDLAVDVLSSGEKRQAIIDVASAFLTSQTEFEKIIILGIDEPEASLNVSKCYEQFEKLKRLSNQNQILITTHWYGFLPVISEGTAYFIENSTQKITAINLFNFKENLKHLKEKDYKSLPNDINLKSINDLIQSIVSAMQSEQPYNWLICEGSSEKIYFDFYFKDEIERYNLRILPVGGASEVKKIYQYLELPIEEIKKDIKGKVICLIDTDIKCIDFITKNDNNLIAYRLINRNNKTELAKINDQQKTPPTEIEDCLNSEIFIDVLNSFNNEEINNILNDGNNLKKDIKLNSYFRFDLRDTDRKTIKDFFDENKGYRKVEFAKKYVEIASNNHQAIEWMEEIKKLFNGEK